MNIRLILVIGNRYLLYCLNAHFFKVDRIIVLFHRKIPVSFFQSRHFSFHLFKCINGKAVTT